jgi:asparagine synthase (glutamine-hydrolysing)
MCGICGVIAHAGVSPVSEPLLQTMNDRLRHRGPDDAGIYLDERAGLAMRRLSIIDLSTGHQPIANEDQSVWIVFNGEIYNHRGLRQRLEAKGHRFATQTDTEAILHGYEEYGDEVVHHLNGMFAFAIWDIPRQRLFLARDRVGIKPLYYYASPERFFFASELKALLAHPDVPRELDLTALDQFLTLEYIPSPRSIFQNVYKLPPGHRLVVENGRFPHPEPYWDIPFQPTSLSDEAACEALTELIRDAVKIRLMADVPLGAFLSGGIDSSAVVAFMSELMDQPVKTFSIGFGDPTYNELPYARLVAASFGTQHHEAFLEADINEMALRLVSHFDEPFGDFSIFPTFLVSEMARRHVTVALSGDGGDELFAGYDTYLAQRMDRRLYGHLPRWLRQQAIPRALDRIPPRPEKKGLVNKSKRFVEGAALPEAWQHTRWMMFLHEQDKAKLYQPDVHAALNGSAPGDLMAAYFRQASPADALAQQQYVDIKTYLAEDILTKVDRMSMAASLEARVPLLDYRIVEFALNLPPHLKLNGKETKVILRRIMADKLPKAVLNKPKEGFSIPLKHWLRGELRPLLHDLLSPHAIQQRGLFNPTTVAQWLAEHEAGRANHSHRLWALMVLELWHRQVAAVSLPR